MAVYYTRPIWFQQKEQPPKVPELPDWPKFKFDYPGLGPGVIPKPPYDIVKLPDDDDYVNVIKPKLPSEPPGPVAAKSTPAPGMNQVERQQLASPWTQAPAAALGQPGPLMRHLTRMQPMQQTGGALSGVTPSVLGQFGAAGTQFATGGQGAGSVPVPTSPLAPGSQAGGVAPRPSPSLPSLPLIQLLMGGSGTPTSSSLALGGTQTASPTGQVGGSIPGLNIPGGSLLGQGGAIQDELFAQTLPPVMAWPPGDPAWKPLPFSATPKDIQSKLPPLYGTEGQVTQLGTTIYGALPGVVENLTRDIEKQKRTVLDLMDIEKGKAINNVLTRLSAAGNVSRSAADAFTLAVETQYAAKKGALAAELEQQKIQNELAAMQSLGQLAESQGNLALKSWAQQRQSWLEERNQALNEARSRFEMYQTRIGDMITSFYNMGVIAKEFDDYVIPLMAWVDEFWRTGYMPTFGEPYDLKAQI